MKLANAPWPVNASYTCDHCGAQYRITTESLEGITEMEPAFRDGKPVADTENRTAKIKCDLCNTVGTLEKNPAPSEIPAPDMTPATVEDDATISAENRAHLQTGRDGTIPQRYGTPEQGHLPADERDDLTPGEYAMLKLHEAAADGPDLLPNLADNREAGTVAYSKQSTDQIGEVRVRTEGSVVTHLTTTGDFPLPDSQEALIEAHADDPISGAAIPGNTLTQREATPTGKLKAESKRIQHGRDVASEKKEADQKATDDKFPADPSVKADKRRADAKQERVDDKARDDAKEQSETVAPAGDAFGPAFKEKDAYNRTIHTDSDGNLIGR